VLLSPTPAPTPTPVVLYVMQPPTGWQTMPLPSAAPGRVELLYISLGPTADGFRSELNVVRDPLPDPSETIEARAQESVTYLESRNAGKVTASHAERLCNGSRDGWLVESTAVHSRALDQVQAILLDDGAEYIATYTRASGASADPAALKALDTLCPQPGTGSAIP